MIDLKQVTTKLRARKKVFVAMFASLLVLILVGLGILLSARAWHDYETSYNTSFGSAKVAIDSALLLTSAKPVLSSADRLGKIVQIQTVLKEGVKSYCNVNPVIKWQGFVKQSANKVSDCEKRKDNFTEFLSKLTDVTAYLKSEQDLAVIIKQANDKTGQNNQSDKWKNVEAFWHQAAAEVTKLPDTDQLKSVKSVNTAKITAIADAWKELSAANDAKNSQKFIEARSNLGVAYDSLIEASANSKDSFDKLSATLSDSYKDID